VHDPRSISLLTLSVVQLSIEPEKEMEMRSRKHGALAIAALAIGAIIASSASAAVTTEAAQWYTGASPGTTLPVGTDQAITASIGTHPVIGAKFELTTSIGGTPIVLTATGLECIGCKITNAVVTSGTTPVAMGKGKIKFTGVTADAPTGCTVRNTTATGEIGVIETTPLTIHADFMNGTVAYQQFVPEAGATMNFATIWLGGGNCSGIEGSYNVRGTLFSEAKNPTGVQAATQENVFSQAIQTTAGAELKLGSVKAELTGTGIFSIGGTAFGIH
jgi:hypothetical protein